MMAWLMVMLFLSSAVPIESKAAKKAGSSATGKLVAAFHKEIGAKDAGKVTVWKDATRPQQVALAGTCIMCHIGRAIIETNFKKKDTEEFDAKLVEACDVKGPEITLPLNQHGADTTDEKVIVACTGILKAMVKELSAMRAAGQSFSKFCLETTGSCVAELDTQNRQSVMKEKKDKIEGLLASLEYFEKAYDNTVKAAGGKVKRFKKYIAATKSWKKLQKAKRLLEDNDDDNEDAVPSVTKDDIKKVMRGVQDSVMTMFTSDYKVNLKAIFIKFKLNEGVEQKKKSDDDDEEEEEEEEEESDEDDEASSEDGEEELEDGDSDNSGAAGDEVDADETKVEDVPDDIDSTEDEEPETKQPVHTDPPKGKASKPQNDEQDDEEAFDISKVEL